MSCNPYFPIKLTVENGRRPINCDVCRLNLLRICSTCGSGRSQNGLKKIAAQEFGPTLSLLFDRSVEHHLAADAIWGLANLVSDILIMGDSNALL